MKITKKHITMRSLTETIQINHSRPTNLPKDNPTNEDALKAKQVGNKKVLYGANFTKKSLVNHRISNAITCHIGR